MRLRGSRKTRTDRPRSSTGSAAAAVDAESGFGIASPSGGTTPNIADPLLHFHPKSDADYQATLRGRQLVKSRRHEALVADFGRWAHGLGFIPSTPHPEDLLLQADGERILVEAKMVYKGNATEAVRGAIGQLTMYSHFLHPGVGRPHLVALFSEDVGKAYRDFLESLGIAGVWWERGTWRGSPLAVNLAIAEPPN